MSISNSRSTPHILPWAVLTLAILEAAQFTYFRNQLGDYISPIVLYFTAVALCLVTAWSVRHKPLPTLLPVAVRGGSWWPGALALTVGLALCLPLLKSRIEGTLAQDYSDIIPALTVYCQRFLNGEVVHRPLTEDLGYFLEPGYLPATWFPFVVSEYFRFDYRWMSTFIMLLGIVSYLITVVRLRRGPLLTFGLGMLPFVFTYYVLRPTDDAVLRANADIFSLTVEPLIIGYYLLLVAGVLLPSRPLFIIALVLCLLSRYSLVFWVPLYVGLVYVNESRQWAWTIVGLAAAGVLAFYVVPVLSHDWGLFMRVQKVYTETTLGEWRNSGEDGRPYHLYNGIGLTNLFYHFGSGDLLTRLKLAKAVHLLSVVAIVIGAALVYWRQRLPRINYRLYAVIVLKLYLTTFYALLQVPYTYLAIVGFFISLYLVVIAVGPAVMESAEATPLQSAFVKDAEVS
ncbi:hypothetical protein [Hymenobacter negativus]|uniref:DUF2029 domain-containing protein n=1 Tax=Hymenobacter negativus TaxID=2795026 RepID=A0ABS3QBB9_9BACT|nr:hypothetical protein [Hymenobacter negativus]MBO2008313.1 hypothetical protein [Hymenobacter negativus]